ncbi:MAG: hypothetical protein M1826_001835 [Phylliscum demangeonii]|nr:MAG: hypothetical protein M1826_001835 [Phylliscum demangeonii]
MAHSSSPTPDLAIVLQTLAQFCRPLPTIPTRLPVPIASISPNTIATPAPSLPVTASSAARTELDPDREEGEYEPAEVMAVDSHLSDPAPAHLPSGSQLAAPRVADSMLPPRASSPAMAEPTLIVDWPSALRCVMKLAARNGDFIATIKRMVQTQHDDERRWWVAREDLIQKQKVRREDQKKLDDVLCDEDDANELLLYDRKVHLTWSAMTKAYHEKLERMGVPFFGTRPQLIVKADGGPLTTAGVMVHGQGKGKGPAEEKGIRQDELDKLQQRMFQLLEDLATE